MNASWVDAWGAAMFRASWQGGLALLLAWGVCATLRHTAPAAKCWLWRLGYLKFVVALAALVTFNLPLLPAMRDHAVPAPEMSVSPSDSPSPGSLAAARAVPENATPVEPPRAAAQPPISSLPAGASSIPPSGAPLRQWLLIIIFILWSLGVALGYARVFRAWGRTRRLRHSATPLADAAVHAQLALLAEKLPVRTLPRLLLAADESGPLLVGIGHPAILLPPALIAPARAESLRLALAHELVHVCRRDVLWNLLQTALEGLFFFHPLIWLARQQLRFHQELACDRRTLAATHATAADYARVLLTIVELYRRARPAVAAVGIADSASLLRRRLLAMTLFQTPSPRRAAVAAVLISIAAVAGVLPWRLVAQTAPRPAMTGSAPAPAIGPALPDAAAVAAATPLTDAPLTQVIPIRFADFIERGKGAAGVASMLSGSLSKGTKVSVDEKHDAVVLTGKSANIHRLAEIIAFWEYTGWGPTPGTMPAPDEPAITPAFQFPGVIDADVVEVQSAQNGRMAAVKVKEGQAVKAGDLLFQLDNRAAQAAVRIAELNLDNAQIVYKSKAQLAANVISQADIEAAKNQMEMANIQLGQAEDALEDLVIRSPIDGKVQTFNVQIDQIVTRGAAMTSVVSNDLHVFIEFPATSMPDVRVGQTVTIIDDRDPPATGEIDFIPSITTPQGTAYRVRAKVVSGDRIDHLKVGMPVNVCFIGTK